MKALLQAFVDVPEMAPQPLLKVPMDFTLAEIRALRNAASIIISNYPLMAGPNLRHGVESLNMVLHAMESWVEEHPE